MDTPIKQPQKFNAKTIFYIGLFSAVVIAFYLISVELFSGGGVSHIDKNDVNFIRPIEAKISQTITAIGIAKPRKSIKLSSDIGGRVKFFLDVDHSTVERNDVLIELENYDYILRLTEKTAQISEQISNLKNMRLNLQRELVSTRLSLDDANFQVQVLNRDYAQKSTLLEQGLINSSEVHNTKDDLTRWKSKKKILSNYYNVQSKQLSSQLSEVNESIALLNELLYKLQKSEQQLVIRAPISGNLVDFDVEYGQQISAKEEFGSIDVVNDFIIEINLTEFYLDRIHESTEAVGKVGTEEFKLKVIKIFPMVKNGRFKMHLRANEKGILGQQVKVGQSIEVILSEENDLTFVEIPPEAIYQEGEHYYLFLLNDNKSSATKVSILIKNDGKGRFLTDDTLVLNQQLVVLNKNKKYKEEVYFE